MSEKTLENNFIEWLKSAGYIYRDDIKNLVDIELNFREKFEKLNYVKLEDEEFRKIKSEIISPDTFKCSQKLRQKHTFERKDGTPLHYTLVNIKDWCKNTFEVIRQPRINTHSSYHQYDCIILMNGIPVVHIELKDYEVNHRRAIQQIMDYKNDYKDDEGNGYLNTLMCFIQIFVVSNGGMTQYFANNNNEHLQFDADEKFLPIYKFADEKHKKRGWPR